MLLSDFDFPFDPKLVADRPVEPRDRARLLLMPRMVGACSHHIVAELPGLLKPGDLLVVNDTKVMAVRLVGKRRASGGHIEIVLVREIEENTWEVLLKGKIEPGQVIDLEPDASATVLARSQSRTVVRIAWSRPVRELIQEVGQMPLPPYIKRVPTDADRVWYQTIFAREEGSIAAPTASLHFTRDLLEALRRREVRVATVTLHVGPATFRPVRTDRVEDHPMGSEPVVLPVETAAAISRTKAAGGRVVAVGTTVMRTLETAATTDGTVHPMSGQTTLFIVPGYQFRVVDALMTNFHLPRTTLLMLVSAFVGLERLREAYREAIRERYRFYSYGDAMLIV